jgi:hypothetical protein
MAKHCVQVLTIHYILVVGLADPGPALSCIVDAISIAVSMSSVFALAPSDR